MSGQQSEPVTPSSPAIRLPQKTFDRLAALRAARQEETGRKMVTYAEVIERLLELQAAMTELDSAVMDVLDGRKPVQP